MQDVDYLIETFPRAVTPCCEDGIEGLVCFAARFARNICFERSRSYNLKALLAPSEWCAHRVLLRAGTLCQKLAIIARSPARYAVSSPESASLFRIKLASRTIYALLWAWNLLSCKCVRVHAVLTPVPAFGACDRKRIPKRHTA